MRFSVEIFLSFTLLKTLETLVLSNAFIDDQALIEWRTLLASYWTQYLVNKSNLEQNQVLKSNFLYIVQRALQIDK